MRTSTEPPSVAAVPMRSASKATNPQPASSATRNKADRHLGCRGISKDDTVENTACYPVPFWRGSVCIRIERRPSLYQSSKNRRRAASGAHSVVRGSPIRRCRVCRNRTRSTCKGTRNNSLPAGSRPCLSRRPGLFHRQRRGSCDSGRERRET